MTTQPAEPRRLSDQNPLLRTILDAFPMAVFLVDPELRVVDYNEAGQGLAAGAEQLVLAAICGEVLGCLHHREAPAGCGTADHCRRCVLRDAAIRAIGGMRAVRRREVMLLGLDDALARVPLLVTASPFAHGGTTYALVVLEHLADILKQGELVTICASCKKIRIDRKQWEPIERYFSARSALQFSHGVCPSCYQELYADELGRDGDAGEE